MKKYFLLILITVLLLTNTTLSYGWGKTGHEIVGKIAYQLLDDSTRQVVQKYLGNLSFEEAANWMDDSRSNAYYNYMRTWHYLDMDKGLNYVPSSERNILTVLHSAITDLKQYKTANKKDIKRDILLIFHLVGDLHQPLHTGYSIDKGGNSIEISSPFVSGNLHSVWDTQILEYKKINMDSCLELLKSMDTATINNIEKINELKWMYQSRSLLDTVYSFENNYLDKKYIDNNTDVIKKQLLFAGMRLASILNEVFKNKTSIAP